MEDLIASLSTSHMSQENLDIESVKAHLARTLVVPASPSSASTDGGSLPRTRPPSLSISSLQGFTFEVSQPLPSPTTTYSSFNFDEVQPSYSSYETYETYEDEASLSAAFATDAFAPMWEKPAPCAAAPADPWCAFHEKKVQVPWGQQPALGIVNVDAQQPLGPQYQYQEYAYDDDDESMDEEEAEAMLDEEEAMNNDTRHRVW